MIEKYEKEICDFFNKYQDRDVQKQFLKEKYNLDVDEIEYFTAKLNDYKSLYDILDSSYFNFFEQNNFRDLMKKICDSIEKKKKNIFIEAKTTEEALKILFTDSKYTTERRTEILVKQFNVEESIAREYASNYKLIKNGREYIERKNRIARNRIFQPSYSENDYDLDIATFESTIHQLSNIIDSKSKSAMTPQQSVEPQTVQSQGFEPAKKIDQPSYQAKEQPLKTQEDKDFELGKKEFKDFILNCPIRQQADCMVEGFGIPKSWADSIVEKFRRIGTPPNEKRPVTSEAAKMLNAQYDMFYSELEYTCKQIQKFVRQNENSIENTVRQR